MIVPKSFNRAQIVFYKDILALQEHLLLNIQYGEVFQALIKTLTLSSSKYHIHNI